MHRVFHFYQFGFDLLVDFVSEKVEMTVVFNDSRDSLNKRHSYMAIFHEDSFKHQNKTLESVLALLEKSYEDDMSFGIDVTEKQKPDRLTLKIYEQESCETLVFIELQ